MLPAKRHLSNTTGVEIWGYPVLCHDRSAIRNNNLRVKPVAQMFSLCREATEGFAKILTNLVTPNTHRDLRNFTPLSWLIGSSCCDLLKQSSFLVELG
jgi:hypothetical protein